MATQHSNFNQTGVQGVSIDNERRIYNFGDRVAELAPLASPFFSYLSKVAKQPTDDPVFKFMERRHQWQRRTFNLKGAIASAAYVAGTQVANIGKVDTTIDKYGKAVSTPVVPLFLLNGQVVAVKDTDGTVRTFQITLAPDQTADGSTAAEIDLTPRFTATCAFADNESGEVIGSAFAEATGAPDSWKDEMFNREGYTQIFKTSIPMFSGTSMSTRYRGVSDEFKRVWAEKMMEHKTDIEKAVLFGVGASDESTTAPKRFTWGIAPYTELYGNVYNMSYGGSDYDAFIDVMQAQFAPETGDSGAKLILTSRGIISWLNKLGEGKGFLANTVGKDQYKMSITNVPGKFGHMLTQVTTTYGTFNFVHEPFMRGPYEDYAVGVDLKNVKYRPLSANGNNRDTFIETNIQTPGTDGRQDLCTTEAGLQIDLPETHFILKFA
jgi:hypothetical protein